MKYMVIRGEKVVRHGSCQPENLQSFVRAPGEIAMFTNIWPGGHWWDTATEELVPKTEMPIEVSKTEFNADGVDSAVLSGVPDAATAKILQSDGMETVTVESGVLELTAVAPGPIIIEIEHARHFDYSVELVAV